jgi:hypothetical protein
MVLDWPARPRPHPHAPSHVRSVSLSARRFPSDQPSPSHLTAPPFPSSHFSTHLWTAERATRQKCSKLHPSTCHPYPACVTSSISRAQLCSHNTGPARGKLFARVTQRRAYSELRFSLRSLGDPVVWRTLQGPQNIDSPSE